MSQLSEGNGMNKAELVDAVASAANLSKADAGRAVDAVLSSISGSLSSGQQVSIVGFGTFSVKHRAARAGRNPRTGETIQIAASNVPGFKAGKALKEAVN
ncbi:MAG: HU family DNA-binding protein [Candidatus Rariloculaceae bacterium]